MNHGSAFQDLWKVLRNEVQALQNKGYYGDGLYFVVLEISCTHAMLKATGLQEQNSVIHQKSPFNWPSLVNFLNI